MSNFKVSIIVPIYNAQIFLKKLIENLTNQTYRNIEIILVNDGSTDNSLNICNELQSKDNRIRVVDKENGGVSSARNKGIKDIIIRYKKDSPKSRGVFFMFCLYIRFIY